MNKQWFQLARIALDPRITTAPLRVLRQLRARGIHRIPENVFHDLNRSVPRAHALKFIREWLDGEQLTRHRGRWVVNSFIPPFPGPSYERMFTNLLSGRHLSPVSAFIAVTAVCTYGCRHCSYRNRGHDKLGTDQWRSIIGQLAELGVSIIGFTGGEPLARNGLDLLVAEAAARGITTILFTAGAGATESRIQALERAGLWACCVSLDDDTAEEHDRLRGFKGAFNQAVATIKWSRAAKLYTMIGSVASRPCVDHRIYERIHALGHRLGVDEYRLVEPMPCGALEHANDALLTPDHVAILRAFHVTTNRKGLTPKVCAFNQVESPEVFGCGAGTQHLFIEADGTVCPCDFTPLGFGSAADESLATIWKRMNLAMGDNPRQHCFIQQHHALVTRLAGGCYPTATTVSEKICREAGSGPLPGYFAMVNQHPERKPEHEP